MRSTLLLLTTALGLVSAQYADQYVTTPVPILKQINRHNEDGSYSYGYEAADGSYKIESKYPTGEVFGKYGFIDDTGSVREIEYGATRRGFEPSGTGINVPPSSVASNSIADPNEPEDDGQYREDPSVYYTDPKYTNGERYEPVSKRLQQLRHQRPYQNSPIPRYSEYQQPAALSQPQYRPAAPQPQYRPEYRAAPQPEYENRRYQQSSPVSQSRYQGHSASHIDFSLGSYTGNYRR